LSVAEGGIAVGYRGALLRPAEVDQSFAAAWDELPASRGVQADFYDSHAWFSSWLNGFPDRENSTRVVAVLQWRDREPVSESVPMGV
jgi:hypothetical protein